MFTTTEIAPSSVLSPFVRCYIHRELDTKGSKITIPTHARHEMVMSFHFGARIVQLHNAKSVKSLHHEYGGVVGLLTQGIGEITFNGYYSFFEIAFKPNGFNRLFRLSPREITNKLFFANDIFNSGINIFYEQLCMAKNLQEMGTLADAYLFSYLKKQKLFDREESMTIVSNIISKERGIVNINRLAADTNMSIRTFERHFIEQVGIPAKLFCNITRFNCALDLKLKNPQMPWTSIALKCGYYDQMHLIKDVKKFAGNTPSIYQKHSPLARESYIKRVEP